MSLVRYGLIGCGMMGREHLANIALLPEARVAAVFEPDPAMRQAAADLAPEAALCDSLEALLATPDLDCLVIASPNHLHVPQLEAIAAQRPLPVLVEKPLGVDPDERARVARLARDYPAPIWTAMEYRYMPPVARLIAEAEAATGGARMLTIREHRFPFLPKVGDWNRFNRNTGGTLVEKCCHFFDLMRHILKAEPVRVAASAGQACNHLDERYAGETPDIWDHGYVLVDFDNRARAMLELCMFAEGSRYQEELSLVGPAGKIECFAPGPARFWPDSLGAPPTPKLILSPRTPPGPREIAAPVDPALLAAGDHNGATYYQHLKFIEVVRGQGAPEVTLTDGWRAAAMGMAAQEAARSGRVVAMEGFW